MVTKHRFGFRAAVFFALVALATAPGCGSGSDTYAHGGIVVLAIAPALGPTPTPITITGGDYSEVIGQEAIVRFIATVGNPFAAGSSNVAEVSGTVATSTTVTAISPAVVICGVPSVTAFVEVVLPSGVTARSAAPIAVFLPPTLTGIAGGNTFPAAIPTAFTLTGTNFGAAGGTVLIHWTATNPIFSGGATDETTTLGTVATPLMIDAVSPMALVCGAATEGAVIDRVEFPDGSCTPPGTSVPVVFEAPTFTSILNTQVGSSNLGTNGFWAAAPEPFDLVGTGFGPVGGTAIVRWEDNGAPTPYAGGTANSIEVPAVIVSATLIQGVSPEAALCQPPLISTAQNLRVLLPDGACSLNNVGVAILEAPTVTAITNLDRAGPVLVPALFFGHIPETFEITGDGFGPIGGTASVLFTETSGTNPTPFSGGTSATATVQAVITSRTTMEGVTPEAVYVTAPGANVGSGVHYLDVGTPTIDVLLGNGSCPGAPFAPGITFVSTALTPAFGSPAPSVPSTIRLGQTSADSFTLTGLGFHPPGSVANVTFDDQGGAGTFNGGASITVQGIVVNETTITGTFPVLDTPRLAADLSAQATVQLVSGTTARCPNAVIFTAPPTITTVANARPPFQQSAPASAVPDTWLTKVPTETTVTGTGFQAGVTDLFYETALGAAFPVGAGLLGTIPEPTATAPGTGTARVVTVPTSIVGASPTDTTLTSATDVTFRVVNPDGQYDERDSLTFETTGVLPNVNAAPRGNNQAEMQLAVNPFDPLNAAVCAHDSTGGFAQMTHTYTLDGGLTWVQASVGPPGSLSADAGAAGDFRFDPMCTFDGFGNYYVVYGRDDGVTRVIEVHRSTDGGATLAYLGFLSFPASLGLDRWTCATGPDAANLARQALYVTLVDFATGDILTAKAQISAGAGPNGEGGTYTSLPGNAVNNDNPVGAGRLYQHGTPSVGPNGETYVTFIEGDGVAFPPVPPTFILADTDLVGGGVFGTDVVVASTQNSAYRLTGGVFVPMPSRGKGLIPVHKVIPVGPNAGRVVVVWSDMNPAGVLGLDTTVVSQYSDDNGLTWSAPQPVHGLDDGYQFFPWIAADPVRGDVYVGYYDTRNDTTNNRAVQWLVTASEDGATWTTSFLVAQAPSDAGLAGGNEMLEYNGIWVVDGCVYTCWADNSNFTGDNPSGTLAADGFDVLTSLLMLDPDDN